MELRQVRTFVTVAEELHFGRAATRLRLAQSAVSMQIRALETNLGVELFTRSHRRVALTTVGALFLEEARRLLHHADRAAAIAGQAAAGEIGEIRFGYVGLALYSVLPSIVRAFRESAPDVTLAMSEMPTPDQLAAITDGRLDAGLVITPPPNTGIACATVSRESQVAAIPADHPLGEREVIRLVDLKDVSIVNFPRHHRPELYDAMVATCQAAGFTPNIVHEVFPHQTIVGMVASGMGIAVVPSSMRNLQRPDVIYRPMEAGLPTVDLDLAWRRDDASPVLRRFLNVVAIVIEERYSGKS